MVDVPDPGVVREIVIEAAKGVGVGQSLLRDASIKDDGSVIPLQVQEGDRIVFGKYSVTEIKVEGEERLILREDDILGVID